ncbi:class I SAM-dependent methyltransferase [Halorussus ruber]|uniref:class I SAM-dependent methyltransferase n=1 Tax=Halorussus ruber TaxID=1126238 RepID=UPI001092DD3A|nr:class I SAM-dependent methyltransferase [Halorussus ruber]
MDGADEAEKNDDASDEATPPERSDVQATYDYIADHFAKTREYAWPEVEEFVADHSNAETVPVALDLGCGNGRHAELLADHADRVVAADVSRGLLDTARERAAERGFDLDLVQADAARLPLWDATVDLAVYVATLHHLPTREARVESLNELARLLTTEGRALVSAWSTAHDRFDSEARSASENRAGEARDGEEGFDTEVDWTLPGGERVERFYHIYSPAEFEADVAESDLELVEFEISSGNCYGTVRGTKQ